MTHTLYGGELSYFTGKARAYLNWKGVDYEEKLSTREVYSQIILPRVGYPIIPVVVTEKDETLQDTSDIIDWFEARDPEPSVYPEGPKQRLAALLLEVYGDEWLKLPAMHYRWNHNEDWMLTEFGKISAPDAEPSEWKAIGEKRAGPFRGSLPFLGVTPETEPAIEASYEGLLAELDAHFAEHDYLFGSRPSIGDFGLIGPLYAHQYRDPASGALMERLAPSMVAWVKRMQKPDAPRTGDFLDGDAVPETVLPVLRRMMGEHLPVLLSTAEAFARWAKENPDTDIPRAIGEHEFELEGVKEKRVIFPFDLWMLQRPLDHYRGLSGAAKEEADRLLETIGGERLKDFPDFPRLKRENFQLVLA